MILVVQTRVMPGSYLGEVEHAGQLISQPAGHSILLFFLDANFVEHQEEEAEIVDHHVEVIDVQDVCTCLYGFVPQIIRHVKIFIQAWSVTVSPMF